MEQSLEAKVSDELARQQLADIRALQESEPFNRYFLWRLANKRKRIAESFENDPPAKVDDREREILRRLLAEYTTIQNMMKVDEASIQAQLSRST